MDELNPTVREQKIYEEMALTSEMVKSMGDRLNPGGVVENTRVNTLTEETSSCSISPEQKESDRPTSALHFESLIK